MKDDENDRNDISPSCIMTVSDFKANMNATCRCDDGTDDSTSTAQTERAVLRGIGRIKAIVTFYLEVSLTKKDENKFSSSMARAFDGTVPQFRLPCNHEYSFSCCRRLVGLLKPRSAVLSCSTYAWIRATSSRTALRLLTVQTAARKPFYSRRVDT